MPESNRRPPRTPIPNAHGSVAVVTVLMPVVLSLPVVVLFVIPIRVAVMRVRCLGRFGPVPPARMMLRRPIRVVLHPPIAVMPMVGVVIIPVVHPCGM